MSSLLGIDLGTSSVKVVVLALDGSIRGIGSADYPILTPSIGCAEQDPEEWWRATVIAVRQAMHQAGHPDISSIGFSGQMHGFSLLGRDRKPLSPAIIWADQRSADLLPEIESIVGPDLQKCGTAPAAGFLISTLFWLQRHQPELLDRALILLMPKDYIRLKITGELGTDESDASATGIFDVKQRTWADDLISRLNLPGSIFPVAEESTHLVGPLTKEAGAELGLVPGLPVSAGSSDQPAQAVGNGLIDPPLGSVTIGTGGQVFVPLDQPLLDPKLRLHTFCHAPRVRWYLLGAMLSAGMALRWFRAILGNERFSYAELDRLAGEIEPGCEGLTFLPYIVGERSPIMDPRARGSFVGLALRHGPAHMARALLEGVVFALRQIIETMEDCGAYLPKMVASGNGLGSPLWRQMLADVINRPLCQGHDAYAAERAGVGAAMIGGIGGGVFKGYEEARTLAPVFDVTTAPNPDRVDQYEAAYRRFLDLYPRLKSWFRKKSE
ncbi:MAG: xylulokinase [Verrucomicrobia bacterium]|nr:xylulokinase [Verrucomicrobiota bacterium]